MKILTKSSEQMRKDGWTFGGTTTDETALAEISRDYIAGGAKDVVFTRGANTILYWARYAPVKLTPYQRNKRLAEEFDKVIDNLETAAESDHNYVNTLELHTSNRKIRIASSTTPGQVMVTIEILKR